MNIFRRVSDIVSSQVNYVLEKMEDPEKMIDLSVEKLEEAVIEMKSIIAVRKSQERSLERALADKKEALDRWKKRAKLASDKDQDDLAREAIKEELRLERIIKSDEDALENIKEALSQLDSSREEAEEKLAEMKAKSSELKIRAASSKERIKTSSLSSDSENRKFEERLAQIRAKIDRWEAQADITHTSIEKEDVRKRFEDMEKDEEVEMELTRLKEAKAKK